MRKRPLVVAVRVNQEEWDWLEGQGMHRGHWFRLALLKAMAQDRAVPADTFFADDYPVEPWDERADLTVLSDPSNT